MEFVELNNETYQRMFQEFQKEDGNELKIILSKDIINMPNETFSEQGIKDLLQSIKTFIHAKLYKHWDKFGVPPVKATIKIEVNIHES